MKTFIILLICLTATVFASAQNVPPYVLSEAEIIPPKLIAENTVKGTTNQSINNYIAKNFIYPDISRLPHEGTEVVQFVISAQGELSEIKIINSVSLEVDKEIVRILQKTNKMWMPGKNNGKYVAMEQEIAVLVKLAASTSSAPSRDFTTIADNYYKKGAKKLFTQHKTRQALHQFEDAIRYKPYDECLLYMRAICNAELGHIETAKQDIARIEILGGMEQSQSYLSENIKELESYKALSAMLSDK